MHIESTGSGPPLVLLHGWALHGGVFAPLAQRLADRYTLHLVDLPGHGHSRDASTPLTLADTAREILSRTPPAPWLAWSLGGLFALKAASLSPRVRGLAMVAATPRFVRGDGWAHAVDPAVFLQFGDELRSDYAGTLERFLALDTIGSEHARSELRTLKDALYARGEPAPRALQDGLRLLEESDLRAALPALSVPSLWLAGRRDRLVPSAGMREAAALAPDSTFIEIAGGGHAPFLGHADAVAAEVDRFMQSLPVASL
ncbi:pimeloyl-ACP methyl ester esterase BioH [Pseudoxanthomonas putridarboris]|uniref:Pimeloyl-[acyl-carrier protein] methyl ester esterase n=1 Tax=Pseudoxanthomonas putridarboris TaxID=752605 RepID=A0ABU9J3R3_9GAMM